MDYGFLMAGPLEPERLRAVLADALGVPVDAVDVTDGDGDMEERDWSAPVSCLHYALTGDIGHVVDVYVDDSHRDLPDEPVLAARLAAGTRGLVLHSAAGGPPSAYWVVTPGGITTRARLHPVDGEEQGYTVDRVETYVPQLPAATVGRIPEVVRDERIPTPAAEAFLEAAGGSETPPPVGDPAVEAATELRMREALVTRMENDRAPSGWYPADHYREDLESRDELEGTASGGERA